MNADLAIALSLVALAITVLAWVRLVLAKELTESKSTVLSTVGFVSVGVAVWNIFKIFQTATPTDTKPVSYTHLTLPTILRV